MTRGKQADVEQPFDMSKVTIDGVEYAVVERTKARMIDGISTGSEMRDVDEILLSNSAVRYQCVSRAGGCGETWDNPRSVMSHLKTHQGVFAARRAQQELAEVSAENERLKRQARETDRRRVKRDAQPATPPASVTNAEGNLQMARRAAMDEMDRGWDLIDEGRKAVEAGAMTLAELGRPVDPELVEKANKWDNMRRMLS